VLSGPALGSAVYAVYVGTTWSAARSLDAGHKTHLRRTARNGEGKVDFIQSIAICLGAAYVGHRSPQTKPKTPFPKGDILLPLAG